MNPCDVKAEESDKLANSWHGYFRTRRGWRKAQSAYGPIEYTTPAFAEQGARVCAEAFFAEGG